MPDQHIVQIKSQVRWRKTGYLPRLGHPRRDDNCCTYEDSNLTMHIEGLQFFISRLRLAKDCITSTADWLTGCTLPG
jgi:hypothetical protein